MTQPVRRRRKRRNNSQNMVKLVGALVILLIAVLVIALCIRPKNPADANDPTGDTTATLDTAPATELVVTSPEKTEFVTVEQALVLQGTSDPAAPVLVNGAVIAQNPDGSFSHTVQLQSGKNQITVTHKDKTLTYNVEYRYTVQRFEPEAQTTFNCGATIQVELLARSGSTIKVTLSGKEISMKQATDQLGSGLAEGFVRYVGQYKLPTNNTEDVNLGKITYTVTYNGVTEVYTSADVICQKAGPVLSSDPSVTPDYGDYIDVGSGYIVEIITGTAETFYGSTLDDNSDPRNNYLPEGTVDYCRQDPVSDKYMLMRCGYRVYISKANYPPPGNKTTVVDCYIGKLPDHNEIGFASLDVVENHTVLTLDCLWKAPFYFDLAPQQYISPGDRDFRVSRLTAEYVDITFCYATVFDGTVTIPESNPLFKSAELTYNGADCTLRLYLKKTGGFYGWDAYYNEAGQLCFSFLNPAKATASNNVYGADLTGIVILLDVGHGGYDGGAEAQKPDGTKVDEAELNLNLANALKAELEKMGATVLMNRTDDASLTVDERIMHLKEVAPDLCIALHQNSISGYPNIGGGLINYFTPYSQKISQYMYEQTKNTGIYSKLYLEWGLYYVARQTVCPVVLMENGYMTNAQDFANMLDENVLTTKAQAMARATAEYFLNIQ